MAQTQKTDFVFGEKDEEKIVLPTAALSCSCW